MEYDFKSIEKKWQACCGYHWVILQDGTIQVVRIMLMYYIDVMGFLDYPEKDWEAAVE